MSAADALDLFIEQRDLLPKRCPSWCINTHEQALEEGNDLPDSSRHVAGDYCTQVPQRGHLELYMTAPHDERTGHWRRAVIEIRVTDDALKQSAALELTTGEARVIVRQLIHLADQADLD